MMEAALVDGVAYRVVRDLTTFGSYALVPLYALLLYQVDSDSARWYLYGVVPLIGAVVALKFVIGRPRPDEVAAVKQLSPSFPSGHAAMAFFTAHWFGTVFERWRWALYAGAVAVAVSRVVLGVHFVSDVVAGSVIGLAVALYVHYLSR